MGSGLQVLKHGASTHIVIYMYAYFSPLYEACGALDLPLLSFESRRNTRIQSGQIQISCLIHINCIYC